ncbi:MAG: reverse transcriptase-like protein [Nitrospirae bacterium]|nr:MAG: reverse transcriptase-like protein [Nitrospirota bacterium]
MRQIPLPKIAPRKAVIYSDGASSGNPGPAGIGAVVIVDDEKETLSEAIGITTNNVAEYTALIRALELARKKGAEEIELYLDSELIVRQLKGIYRVKNKKLIPLYERVKELLEGFCRVKITHVPRELNKEADALSKRALKKGI